MLFSFLQEYLYFQLSETIVVLGKRSQPTEQEKAGLFGHSDYGQRREWARLK